MTALDVDGTTFTFADSWVATKYDEWTFYRRQFIRTGARAVDVLAVTPDDRVFLIEAKDYTHADDSTRIPLEDLPSTVAAKARDTLGGLLAARLRAMDSEQRTAIRAVGASEIRVVLHIDLPDKGGRLRNPQKIVVDLRTRLRNAAKGIDPHALVVLSGVTEAAWSTSRTLILLPNPNP